jgi:hypothetical protein
VRRGRLLPINFHHLRQPRRFAAVGPCIAISAYAESVGKVVGLMKVEVSLFAGLLVIATTLLARAQIQGLEGALLSMAVEYSFRGVRAGSRILHKLSYWIG